MYSFASENNIKHIRVVVNKNVRIILHVKQNYPYISEIGTHELNSALFVLKFHDVYNFNLHKFIKFAMNERPKLFEEYYELHFVLQYYHTRNSHFNLSPLDWGNYYFSKYKIEVCPGLIIKRLC